MERKKLFVAFLALLLAVQLAFSDPFGDWRTKNGTYFANRLNGWMPLAVAAILICLFANILIYMAGMAFQSENLKRYAYSEFLQVTASALMVFFAVSLLYTLSNGGAGISALDFMGTVIGAGDSSVDCAAITTGTPGKFIIWKEYPQFGSGPIGAFKCKLQEKITALERAYNNVVESNMPVERSESMCFNMFGVPIYCGSWDLALHVQVEKAHLIANKIVGLLMPLHGMYVLAEYIQRNMLTVFLPAGLVLRILPFTRGVGGLFIAIAIGFFFIFPTFFLLTDPTFVKVDEPRRDMLQGACFTGFKGASVLLAAAFGPNPAAAASELDISRAEELVYQLTIGTMFYPFISLVITLMFVRAVAPLLGGDLGELMKMVSRLG